MEFSKLDTNTKVSGLCITLGYVLPLNIDVDSLDKTLQTAVRNVVHRTPFLLGRLKMDNHTYVNVIPARPLSKSYKTHSFRRLKTRKTVSLPAAVVPTNAFVCRKPPAVYLFHDPQLPQNAHGFLDDVPYLAISIVEASNAVCVGISLPHIIVDGMGMGKIIRMLAAEVRREDYQVILSKGCSPLSAALFTHPSFERQNTLNMDPQALYDPISVDQKEETSPFYGWSPYSLRAGFRYFRKMLFERWFKQSRFGYVFLGNEKIQRMVQPIKAQVKTMTDGVEYVSTGDVLVAWILKSSYQNQYSERRVVDSHGMYDFRAIYPGLELYAHNASCNFPYTSYTVNELGNTSLADLSLNCRQSLNRAKSPEFIQNMMKEIIPPGAYSKGAIPISPLPKRDLWVFSNKIKTGIDQMAFGCDEKGIGQWDGLYWSFLSPEVTLMDSYVSISKIPTGVIFYLRTRNERWQSLEQAIAQL